MSLKSAFLHPPSPPTPQSRVCAWTMTSRGAGFVMVPQMGPPTWSLSSQLWFILSGTHSSPGPGTLGLYTFLVRLVSCISACFPVPFSQHILSLLKGVSVFYSNVEHTLLKRRLKSPEDTYHRGNLGKRLRRWVIFSGFC